MSDSKPKGPPPRPRKIWSFDHAAGWSKTDDPAPAKPDEYGDAALRRAGYLCLRAWPHEDSALWAELHERGTPSGAEWLLIVSSPFTAHCVRVSDLPSLLALLRQLLPVLEAGGRLDAINDKHEADLEQRRQERAARPRTAAKGGR